MEIHTAQSPLCPPENNTARKPVREEWIWHAVSPTLLTQPLDQQNGCRTRTSGNRIGARGVISRKQSTALSCVGCFSYWATRSGVR